jgi:hypothetical protein
MFQKSLVVYAPAKILKILMQSKLYLIYNYRVIYFSNVQDFIHTNREERGFSACPLSIIS